MKISTKYFALLRERLGISGEEFELPSNATVSDFIREFRQRHWDKVDDLFVQNELRPGFAVAINGENIDPRLWKTTVLKEGDVVVVLPPIAGGYLKLGKRTPLCP